MTLTKNLIFVRVNEDETPPTLAQINKIERAKRQFHVGREEDSVERLWGNSKNPLFEVYEDEKKEALAQINKAEYIELAKKNFKEYLKFEKNYKDDPVVEKILAERKIFYDKALGDDKVVLASWARYIRGGRVIVCFDDKAKTKSPLTFTAISEEELKKYNTQGWGIFESVNSFHATKEQLDALYEERMTAWRKNKDDAVKNNKDTPRKPSYPTVRLGEFLTRLNAVYADMDVCKDGEMPEQEREEKKSLLLEAIRGYCPASVYLMTKNGIQPMWWIQESDIDEKTQQRYVNILKGIVEWSKKRGSLGDKVYDIPRVLRKANYLHQKSEPFLIKKEEGNKHTYTLAQLEDYFRYEEPVYTPQKQELGDIDPSWQALNDIDLKRIVIDLWTDKGHTASFNEQNHLIIDGKVTATFMNRDGKSFIASTSGEFGDLVGNRVTYTAKFLKISNKEAFIYLCKKYNIENKPLTETSTNLTNDPTNTDVILGTDKLKGLNQTERNHELAKILIKHYSVKTFADDTGDKRLIYIFKDGFYQRGINELRKQINHILGKTHRIGAENEILAQVKNISVAERTKPAKEFINLQNGVFNLETNALIKEPDPDKLFFNKLPVTYNPNADCLNIKAFLSEMLEPQFVQIIQEWAGFLVFRDYFLKKGIIFVGDRDTGKTVLLWVLERFIGKENISGAGLQSLMTDRFAKSALCDKYANICDELSARDMRDIGTFKELTGQSLIQTERKFEGVFSFRNHAKLTFACNKIPTPSNDIDDDAYFSRWIVVPFNNFISQEKRDTRLIDKLTTKEELSGFFNFALEGLREIQKNSAFTYTDNVDEIKLQMLLYSGRKPIVAFVNECIEEQKTGFIYNDEMFRIFALWTAREELPSLTDNVFSKQFTQYVTYASSSRMRNPDKKNAKGESIAEKGFRGVRFKKGIRDTLTKEVDEQEEAEILDDLDAYQSTLENSSSQGVEKERGEKPF